MIKSFFPIIFISLLSSPFLVPAVGQTFKQSVQLERAGTLDFFIDQFGSAVAIHGDYAISTALRGGGDGVNSDSALIYKYDDVTDSWTEVKRLLPSLSSPRDNYGISVGCRYSRSLCPWSSFCRPIN